MPAERGGSTEELLEQLLLAVRQTNDLLQRLLVVASDPSSGQRAEVEREHDEAESRQELRDSGRYETELNQHPRDRS